MKTAQEWRSYFSSVGVSNTGPTEIDQILLDMKELEKQLDAYRSTLWVMEADVKDIHEIARRYVNE